MSPDFFTRAPAGVRRRFVVFSAIIGRSREALEPRYRGAELNWAVRVDNISNRAADIVYLKDAVDAGIDP